MQRLILCFSFGVFLTSVVNAEIVRTVSEFDFDEFQNSDDYFSDLPSAPTPIGELQVGSTLVAGFLGPVLFDADIFTFTIAPGTQLNAITVISIDGDGHFFGLDAGNTTIDPSANYDGSSLLVARLFGGVDIDSDLMDPVPATGVNFNLANDRVTAGPGDYTIWLQENAISDPYTYALSLDVGVGVAAIPEPSSVLLLSVAATGLAVRRRRR